MMFGFNREGLHHAVGPVEPDGCDVYRTGVLPAFRLPPSADKPTDPPRRGTIETIIQLFTGRLP